MRRAVSAFSGRVADSLYGLATCWRWRSVRAMLASVALLPVFVGGASAATVQGLYGATVDLLPGERAASSATAQRALAAVLVKVTGLADLSGSTLVAPVLAQADRLVQQQGFVSRRTLRYVFDEGATRNALLGAGLPYWDDDRPVALVLLQVPAALLDEATASAPGAGAEASAPITGAGVAWTERYLHTGDELPGLNALQGAAARRGLPLLLPAPEWLIGVRPEERTAVAPAPSATLGVQSLARDENHPGLALARRHGADLVLIGEGDRTRAGAWQVRWRLLEDAQVQPWIGGLETGPEYLADLLASRYAAYAGAGLQRVDLELTGIDSAPAYAQTLAYLRRLDLVQRVDLRQVRAGRLLLSLESRYEVQKLARLLQLAKFLTPVSGGPGGPPGTLRFEYRAAAAVDGPGPNRDGEGTP